MCRSRFRSRSIFRSVSRFRCRSIFRSCSRFRPRSRSSFRSRFRFRCRPRLRSRSRFWTRQRVKFTINLIKYNLCNVWSNKTYLRWKLNDLSIISGFSDTSLSISRSHSLFQRLKEEFSIPERTISSEPFHGSISGISYKYMRIRWMQIQEFNYNLCKNIP